MQRFELPKVARDLIEEYSHLPIAGKDVRTPYYRNVKRVRAELRSLVGKGSPDEINDDVSIFSKLRGFDLKVSTPDQIREFMEQEGIGIDCSGFVAHIYDRWLRSSGQGGIGKNIIWPKVTLRRKLINIIRPIENISADLLTGKLNSEPIQLSNVRVGDLIRLKGAKQGDHVVIVSRIFFEKKEDLGEIEYTHSSPHYGSGNGIRKGIIKIIDPKKGLEDQEWLELDINGVCHTKIGYLRELHDNGLVRPKFIENLKWEQ